MLRGLFVTGTDTGVGKTVVSAALMLRYADGPVRYWKPVQTGIEHDDDTRTVAALTGLPVLDAGVRLPRPLSPHLAARLASSPIDVEALTALAHAQTESDRFVVEGAGGIFVPLTDRAMVIDLVQRLALPVVVVARTTLGTINHSVLTVDALRARGVEVLGVILDGPENPENLDAIATYGRVPILGHIPVIEPLTHETLREASARLDPQGRLREHLTA